MTLHFRHHLLAVAAAATLVTALSGCAPLVVGGMALVAVD